MLTDKIRQQRRSGEIHVYECAHTGHVRILGSIPKEYIRSREFGGKHLARSMLFYSLFCSCDIGLVSLNDTNVLDISV